MPPHLPGHAEPTMKKITVIHQVAGLSSKIWTILNLSFYAVKCKQKDHNVRTDKLHYCMYW